MKKILFILFVSVFIFESNAKSQLYGVTPAGGGNNAGSIFHLNSSLTSVITDVSFAAPSGNTGYNGVNGYTPVGPLTLINGKFYGLANGGTDNFGIIFQWDPVTNTYTKKFDFKNGQTGTRPRGRLVQSGNKLYGATTSGSANDYGAFFEYDPATNTYLDKHSFPGGTTRGGLHTLSLFNGKFYGTSQVESSDNGNIFEWDPATDIYTVKTVFSFENGVQPECYLALYGNKFYGTTPWGGANNKGVIFEWDPVTNIYTKKIDLDGAIGSNPRATMVIKDGKFYGTTSAGGAYNGGVIFEWDPANNNFTKKIDFQANNGYNKYNYNPTAPLTLIGGMFFDVTSDGGVNDLGVIFQWDPVTNVYTKKLDFNGQNGAGANVELVDYTPSTALVCPASTTLYVDTNSSAATPDGSSWNNAYKELRDALKIAQQCPNIAIINVAQGTYKPTDNNNRDSTFPILRGGIKLYGGFPTHGGSRDVIANPTILSGDINTANIHTDNSYHVMVIAGLGSSADSVVVDGFTITRGAANDGFGSTKSYNGSIVSNLLCGGIYLINNNGAGGRIAIRNCTISLNIGNVGGGMYNEQSSPSLKNCLFSSNSGGNSGGGLYNYSNSSPKLFNCIFSSNQASFGGGMFNRILSSPVIDSCTFSLNTGVIGGGGLYNDDHASPSLTNCTFTSNNGVNAGGGLYSQYSSPILTNCTFSSNTSPQGAGVYDYYSVSNLVNCAFLSNTANVGGGIFITTNADDPTRLVNCIFNGNSASAGGGVYIAERAGPVFTNSTFRNNTATSGATGGGAINNNSGVYVPQIFNCIIYDNSSGIDNTSTTTLVASFSLVQGDYTGTSNINVDPQFVNTADPDGPDNILRTADDGLALQPGSPAINMGSNAAVPSGITTDIKGSPRIQSGTVDMGAYEAAVLPTTFYSKPAGDLHNTLTFGSNSDGSGINPTNFNSGTFVLANRASGIYTMTGNWAVGGFINIPSGSKLEIKEFILSEAGLTGTGTLSGSSASNLVITGSNGGDAGTLNFTTGSGSLNNLTLNRSGTAASVSLGSVPLSVYGVLNITSGTLNTGSLLTLKSTAASTARVAPVLGSLTGSVTVERYIPARRAWRILAAPVSGSQSINAAWQEGATTTGANPVPDYGTFITGGSVANGFDQNPGATASIKTYNSAVNNWAAVPNTYNTAVSSNAYMTFVYGSRSTFNISSNLPATNTTLRVTGSLKTGDQVFPVSTTGFTGIPNPFASPIDFHSVTRINVADNFYLWDPKLGGTNGVGAYVSMSWNGTAYDMVPAPVSPESRYIQSGQGFLVSATSAGASIRIKETDKAATPATNVFRTTGEATDLPPQFQDPATGQGLRINLQSVNADGSSSILDEVFSSYKLDYTPQVDKMDALKAPNIQENLGIIREGQILVIERKPLPSVNDTIPLKLWNTAEKAYLFEINPVNIQGLAVSAFLRDKYLNTMTPVSLNKLSQVYFTVTSESGSAATDRFSLILAKNDAPDLLGIRNITVYPNPVITANISLQFNNQPKGNYRVTVTNSAGQVVLERTMQHGGGSAVQSLPLSKKLPVGVYQLQVTGKDMKQTISILSR